LTPEPNSTTDLIPSQDTSALKSLNPEERQQLLARHFHDRMTQGDSFEEVNEYRKLFFAEVVGMAKKVGLCLFLFAM